MSFPAITIQLVSPPLTMTLTADMASDGTARNGAASLLQEHRSLNVISGQISPDRASLWGKPREGSRPTPQTRTMGD
jgi:hypothetical protein